MAQTYYDDGDVGTKPQPTTVQEGMERTEEREEKENQETALIPSSLCPGMKPGDVIELRIVRTHDKEYEVAYEPEESEGGKSEEEIGEQNTMGARGDAAMSEY